MTDALTTPPTVDPADVDGVIQAVRFELYRENVYGALEMVEAADARRPDVRYAEQAARIRSWLGHLESREAYIAAQEEQYKGLRWKPGLKLLERRIRMLIGKKTRKMIARRGRDPEFQELEREVELVKPRRLLDAGCGEGGVAMALAARPSLLLLDEPVTGMNLEESERVMTLVKTIRDRGTTILLVEHNMKAVMGTCERIVVLNFGQKLAEGSPAEVSTSPAVIEAYLGAGVAGA